MPTTWAEWRDGDGGDQAQLGKDRCAIFLPTNEWPQPVILGMQAGSPLLQDGGRYGAFSDPEFRRALRLLLELFRDGLAPVFGNTEIANLYQEFERGTSRCTSPARGTSASSAGACRADAAGQVGDRAAARPHRRRDGVSTAGGSSLVVFRGSEHQAEAWKLIEFLSRPEQQVRF